MDYEEYQNTGKPCVAIIIPPGRELEWLFHSKKGQRQLGQQVKCERLLIFAMVPGNTENGTLESIKNELNPHIRELRPRSMRTDLGGS